MRIAAAILLGAATALPAGEAAAQAFALDCGPRETPVEVYLDIGQGQLTLSGGSAFDLFTTVVERSDGGRYRAFAAGNAGGDRQVVLFVAPLARLEYWAGGRFQRALDCVAG